MGNSSSSNSPSTALKGDSDRKDDFMSDDSENSPLIQSERESERFIVERSLMGIMVNRAESRVRVRQGRQLRESENFRALLSRTERYAVTPDHTAEATSPAAVSSEITFLEPATSIFGDATSNTSNEENENDNTGQSTPVATAAMQPIISLPMPATVKVAQREFDFSKEGEHIPLRERLRLKRDEELKIQREREERIAAFSNANAAPEIIPEATKAEPVQSMSPSSEVSVTADAASGEAASQEDASLSEPSSEAPQESLASAPTPSEEPERKLHVTVPSLAVSPIQSDRYDAIVTEAKVNVWDATQKRLDALSKLEQTLEAAEDKMKSIPRLAQPSKRCAIFEERLIACIHASETIPDLDGRRVACAADRELLMSCFKSQE